MTDSSVDDIEVLARRSGLMRALSDGLRTKRELVDDRSVSRSTIDRAVRVLESRSLVERDHGVSLTLRGRLALDAYEELEATIAAVDAAGGVLDPLPADATFDAVFLRGADVVRPDPVSPQRPYVSYQQLVRDAVAVRGFAPVVLEDNVPVFRDRIVEDGMGVDLTVSPDALDELVSGHSDVVEEALASGNLTLRRARTTLAYALVLVELAEQTVACALVYGDSGLAGAIHNDTPDAVRWAERVYERLREHAQPLHD